MGNLNTLPLKTVILQLSMTCLFEKIVNFNILLFGNVKCTNNMKCLLV